MKETDIHQYLSPFRKEVIRIRRDLHQIPELAFKEEKTSAYVADYLRQKGLSVTTGIARHGVVGLLEGAGPGPTLMIRADMDALPITEATGLDFASTHPGIMHACGHDAHMAMALTAAAAITGLKNRLKGNVKFVFQPAEEGVGGAAPMIAEGVLENPGVDVALGCHVWPDIPEGTIGVRDGAFMASMSSFEITVKGCGGHGAMPHLCVDALEVGTQVVSALQRIVSRKLNPLHPAVITVGRFEAGTAANIIPQTARLSGTVRTFDLPTWENWAQIIEPVVKGVCNSMNAAYDFQYQKGYPPLVNDKAVSEKVCGYAVEVLGEAQAVRPEPSMGSEDMAFFLQKVPGCFFCLGVGNENSVPIHHPGFAFDEAVMINGVALYCTAALDLLKGPEIQ